MTPFNEGLVQGYVDTLPDGRTHFHFYGSNQIEDWIANLTFFKKKWRGVWVHTGFSDMAERALKIIGPADNLFITGHSMGADIALLAGLALHQQGRKVEVEACAPAKAGGFSWWWACRKIRITRWHVEGDPVSILPPFFVGIWLHVGKTRTIIPPAGTNLIERHLAPAYAPYVSYPL